MQLNTFNQTVARIYARIVHCTHLARFSDLELVRFQTPITRAE